ncbi:hypothetical protein JRI60_42865 [Archangium violaceum]|uniref:hypothetical protein n=1 Tax=Archangium violaceum TaxID=83451 RepID=UPI00194E371C|nr:hypothetical protein [Archangium violaceum]QRN95726.1 hypothetical protein JRI60_42865 [Archangium violaceum]
MKWKFHRFVVLGIALIALPVLAAQAGPPSGDTGAGTKRITVNGVQLDDQAVRSLEAAYGPLASGDVWYDPLSGLWGLWGGPAAGQIAPGLKLGGPLPFDASGGRTDFIINGRAIHPSEHQALIAMYGQAIPGRYWLDGAGNFGVEGGPALLNIHALGAGRGGQPSYYSGPGGTISSDGRCTLINTAGGASVLTGDCQ